MPLNINPGPFHRAAVSFHKTKDLTSPLFENHGYRCDDQDEAGKVIPA